MLIGDAAHALSPQLGQGANLALLDAAALADCDSLDEFEAARRPQTRFYALRVARPQRRCSKATSGRHGLVRDRLMGPGLPAPVGASPRWKCSPGVRLARLDCLSV